MTVIPFQRPGRPGATPPPMFNVPPLTLGTIIAFFAVYLVMQILPPEARRVWGYGLAFVPARYTDGDPLSLWALIAPFTHLFLHGGWFHIAMNSLMLLAFGAGTERAMGRGRTAFLFILSGLGGALAQFALGPLSPIPMIGASGALSGLFAAMVLRLQKSGMMPMGRFGIWGVAALWIGLSFLMALAGGAVGIGNVAWAAHAGGFITGVALMRLRYFSA